MFGLFKKKDPICWMKQEKGKGIEKYNKWFCSENCVSEFENHIKQKAKTMEKSGSCCH